jgi:hypothetical protein
MVEWLHGRIQDSHEEAQKPQMEKLNRRRDANDAN